MADLNPTLWYQLYIKRDKRRGLAALNLSSRNETMGSTLYKGFDRYNATQRWQWYGINSTTYVLRCEVSGPEAFLGTTYSPSEETPGKTRAVMVKGSVTDDSIYWTFSPWEDGTFFMTNKKNGTNWHLEKRYSGSIVLSSNVTAPQDGQRWSFEPIEAINNVKYSTISLPNQPIITIPTSTNSADPTQTTSTNLPDSTQTTYTNPSNATRITNTNPTDSTTSSPNPVPSGLSTSAKAGIGTGIGLLAFIAFTALVFFLLRRRKKQSIVDLDGTGQNDETGGGVQEIRNGGKFEMGDEEARHEIAQGESLKYGQRGVVYEMSSAQAPVELPSSKVGAITQ